MGRKYTYDRKDEELFLRLFLNFIVPFKIKIPLLKRLINSLSSFIKKIRHNYHHYPLFKK